MSIFVTAGAGLNPSSPYAAGKNAAQHSVRAAAHTFGFGTITPTSNNYGPFQFPEKLLPLAISNAMQGLPIPVYGAGLREGDWVHVADNCRALIPVLKKGRLSETCHIGRQMLLRNLEVLKTLLKEVGQPESLLTRDNWIPAIPFEKGLASTVAWYRDNQDWVQRTRNGRHKNHYHKIYGDSLDKA